MYFITDPLPGAEKPSLDACSKLSVSNTIYNVTLRGGIKSGNFTDKGVVKNMDECSAFCCADERCNVAFLIRDNCFLVTCKDYGSCAMKPALSEYYHPRLAYVNWSPPDDEIPGTVKPVITCNKPVPDIRIVGKGARNRATAWRTASEKKAGKMDGELPPLPSLPAFFRSLCPVRAFPHYLNAWGRLTCNKRTL